MRYGDWDWALYHEDAMVVRGMGDSEEEAKSACVRAYEEHAQAVGRKMAVHKLRGRQSQALAPCYDRR
jgi:hypothetical protein